MIISRGRKYIFVHAPKTGGTSLSLALEGRAMRDDLLVGDTPKAVKRRGRLKDLQTAGRLWKHSTLADIEGAVSRDGMSEMFVFTLTRNPWDRIVSYYHWLQTQTFDHPAVRAAQAHTFSDFLRQKGILAAFASQPIRSMSRDSRGKDHARLVARLETIETDLDPLWDHLGFRLAIAHVNRSERKADYRTYYSDEDADLVGQACAADVEDGCYKFNAVAGM